MNDFMEEGVDFIIASIRTDSVLELMSWAKPYSIDKLNDAALLFIGRHMQNQPDLCLIVTRFVTKVMVDILK